LGFLLAFRVPLDVFGGRADRCLGLVFAAEPAQESRWSSGCGRCIHYAKSRHRYVHHTFTNVLGKDRDLGYAAMRVEPEQQWKPIYLLQPLYNIGLALGFEYGIAIYDIELEEVAAGRKPLVCGAQGARRAVGQGPGPAG
jgi:hypothetical protein